MDNKQKTTGDRRFSKRVLSIIMILIGTIALALGCIGVVLPILPTTPFFLLTLVCYAKGSARFERWFKSTRLYKKYLEPFIKTRAMTNANKARVLVFVTILIGLPMIFVDVLPMRIVLSVVLVAHYIGFIFFVKSVSQKQLEELLALKNGSENELVKEN